jgi:hypothetical protein
MNSTIGARHRTPVVFSRCENYDPFGRAVLQSSSSSILTKDCDTAYGEVASHHSAVSTYSVMVRRRDILHDRVAPARQYVTAIRPKTKLVLGHEPFSHHALHE